jgi:hypothetical protein
VYKKIAFTKIEFCIYELAFCMIRLTFEGEIFNNICLPSTAYTVFCSQQEFSADNLGDGFTLQA